MSFIDDWLSSLVAGIRDWTDSDPYEFVEVDEPE